MIQVTDKKGEISPGIMKVCNPKAQTLIVLIAINRS